MAVFLGEIIAEHRLVAPGETAICDDHYGGPRPLPTRAVRPKTAAEKAFVALGPAAEDFIKAAAAGVDHARRRPRRAVRHGGGPRPERPHRRH